MEAPVKSKYATVPAHDERLNIVLPATLKRQVFEKAASQGIPASQLIRQAIAAVASEALAA